MSSSNPDQPVGPPITPRFSSGSGSPDLKSMTEVFSRAIFGPKWAEQQERLRAANEEVTLGALEAQIANQRREQRLATITHVGSAVCVLAICTLILFGCAAGIDAALRFLGAI